MGKICEYTCPSCNTIWSIHIGHGMEHAILENILDVFPTEVQKKIISDTKEEQFPYFEFNYYPAVCHECQNIVSVPVIHLYKSGHTYSSVCPDCGKPVDVQSENIGFLCPLCKESTLLSLETGTWD